MSLRRSAVVASLLACLLTAGSWAQEAPAKPKTVKVERGPCHLDVTMRGVFEAGASQELIIRPETWAGFTVLKAVPHGSPVKKGDSLLTLDMTKIDEALKDMTASVQAAELALQLAEKELAVLEQTTPLDLEAAERVRRNADEDLERFLTIDRPAAEESAHFSVKNSTHNVEYVREELRQLEKMYRAKDLTEETEEIILRRQRNQLENAEFFLKSSLRNRDNTLKTSLPRQEINMREIARRHAISHERAKLTLPLTLAQKRHELARQKREFEKAKERLDKLQGDRKLMEVASPADGLAFYGRAVRGQFQQLSEFERAFSSGQMQTGVVLFTIVDPASLRVRAVAEEKDRETLQVGQGGKVSPTAFPKNKLAAKIDAISQVLVPSGGFDVQMSLVTGERLEGVAPGYSASIKVRTYSKSDALLVPASAVFSEEGDEDATYVWLPGEEPKKQTVKTGVKMGSKIEILEGLKEGDEILAEKPAPKSPSAEPKKGS